MLFQDRHDAGKILAGRLLHLAKRDDVIVLGLPRGGVPVAAEVAAALRAPLDVFVVRKLGMPGRPEFAMGAIASGGLRVLNDDIIEAFDVPASIINAVAEQESRELESRDESYRRGLPPLDVHNKTVVLVDDGLATGATIRAAARALRKVAARLVIAVPVGAGDALLAIEKEADEVVCAFTPYPFLSVGRWYRDFSQTTDDDVKELLAQGGQRQAPVRTGGGNVPARPESLPRRTPFVTP